MIRITSPIGLRPGRPQHQRYTYRCTIRALRSALVLVAIAVPALAQNGTRPKDSGVRWDDGSLRAGDGVRLEPHARFQTDLLLTDQERPIDDRFDWARRRIGIDGELLDRVEFQIERELETESPWRDIYGDVKIVQALRIRAGRFKLPFSLEHSTSGFDLDFLERASAVEAMSPGRDLGVMAHGRVARRMLKYEIGLFRHTDSIEVPVDGNRSDATAGRFGTFAGRVTVSPVRDNDDGTTRDLAFGVALVRNTMPEGLYGVVGRAFDGERVSERMYVNGARTRLGIESLWSAGRFTLKGELLQLVDERKQQAITGEDLSNLIVRGAYLTGVWRVAGKHGKRGSAVDVSARFDRLSFSSANTTDEAFANPRADRVAPLSQRAWTFGATWIVNRWVRVQGNAVREQLIDPLGVRDLAPVSPWTTVMRLQFGL
jgi:phosphate-selective porin OprO and OprP